jgi:hypothetical protein
MEDWRIEVDLPDDGHRLGFLAHLTGVDAEAEELEGDFELSFYERLVVSRDGSSVFVYPHDEQQARRAEQAIRAVIAQHGWEARVAVTRWHEAEQAWEPADIALPHDGAQRRAEHEHLIERERSETAKEGHFEFDVVVTLPHHGQAKELAAALEGEGFTVARRWRYVVIGAADEDAAASVAKRVEREAPEGSTTAVFTAENLRDTVNYVAAAAGDNPFAIPHWPPLAR